MSFFSIYQYLAPAVLTPVCYWLWLARYGGRHDCALLVMSMPILFAYVIPGIGTNVLGVWEINSRLRLGKFRPHHGFVFGSATAMLSLVCLAPPPTSIGGVEIIRSGVVLGSVLGFWNWFYDIEAIKARVIVVYNRQHAERQGAEAIAYDYAPYIFGGFGFCYGSAVRIVERFIYLQRQSNLYWVLAIVCNLVVLTAPVGLFMLASYIRNGNIGFRPVKEVEPSCKVDSMNAHDQARG